MASLSIHGLRDSGPGTLVARICKSCNFAFNTTNSIFQHYYSHIILLILNVCRLEKQATFEHLALSEIKKWSSTVYQAFKNIMSVVLLSPFLTSEFIQQAAVVSLMLFLNILKISKISR